MKWIAKWRGDKVLLLILLLAACLNGVNIWTEKYANTYYTMTVGSMLQSASNFFFGSLDSAGSVTVDKPPVVFWIQAVSAWIFGLHGWSVILPQAVAGVVSVFLIYQIVRPTFGLTAARISALVLAVMPVAVAVSRTNNIDSMLVFALLLGTWLLFRGVREGRFWSVFGAFAMIGVAFNMKMLQAYMVLPAFYLFYLIAAKTHWKKKIGTLAASTAILAVVSLSWAVTVDAIPKDQRPYIGSSETNSVLELAFGYNGVSRLTGNKGGGPGGAPGQDGSGSRLDGRRMDGQRTDGQNAQQPVPSDALGGAAGGASGVAPGDGQGQMNAGGNMQGQPPGFGGNDGNRAGGQGGMFNTGTKGPFRLFQKELSGQASWMIPFAALASIGLFASFRRRNFTQKHKEALFWLAWLVPVMGFFSIAGFFHQYYLIMMDAPIAALVGMGWTELWSAYRQAQGWTSWLLPAAIAATAALQWYILHPYDSEVGSGWSIAVAAGGLGIAAILAWARGRQVQRLPAAGAIGLLIMLIGPTYWAFTPIVYGQNSMLPAAGPTASREMSGMPGMPGGGPNGQGGAQPAFGQMDDGTRGDRTNRGGMNGGPGGGSFNQGLYTYLKEHNGDATYLFATTSYGTAAPYIIDKNEKVIAMGGFSGNDPVYTTEKLQSLVKEGKLKYMLIGGMGMGMGGRGGSSDLTAWLQTHGTVIPASAYGGTDSNQANTGDQADNFRMFGGEGGTLYELKAE